MKVEVKWARDSDRVLGRLLLFRAIRFCCSTLPTTAARIGGNCKIALEKRCRDKRLE